ncbi:hypothetical protein ACSNOH_02215 [Streptomyces sp. URMC 127]|uniref:hypothetical protein n=1 Tax=Streptomyces sp. URMC 127 TaxID=3423402 RepID=UPI003F19DD78
MTIENPAAYWGELWASSPRYSPLTTAETAFLGQYAGPGRGRLALDIGCGDGTLTRHLAGLGYGDRARLHPAASARAEPSTEAVRYICADQRRVPKAC